MRKAIQDKCLDSEEDGTSDENFDETEEDDESGVEDESGAEESDNSDEVIPANALIKNILLNFQKQSQGEEDNTKRLRKSLADIPFDVLQVCLFGVQF